MKCYVEVYGCTANKSDAHLVQGLISSHPEYCLVSTIKEADLIILLTCTVIGTTEQRMLHRIAELNEMNKKMVISGCMASIQQNIIKKRCPHGFLVPPQNIHKLLDILSQKKNDGTINHKAKGPKQYHDLFAPISIAEGCLFSCSYCITHLARGTLVSFPEQTIIQSVKHAIKQGCKEIQLTAQDTASYGLDQGSSLPSLLEKIVSINGEFMIRIGMMNPRTAITIFPQLLEIYQHKNVYSFLHLPLQSGDNTILKKMNRGYTVEQALNIIYSARKNIPDITIATDVIIGFPSETDTQFQKTKHLLTKIQPDVVNITRFSARPFTKAKTMPDRIPTEIVKKRSREITEFCNQLMLQRNIRYIGRTLSILPLKKGKQHSVIARSHNYKPVIIKKPVPLGVKRTVEITDATSTHLVGMLK